MSTSKGRQFKIPDQYGALNKTKVSQEGYQQIAAVNFIILREGAISNECILLNKQIEANIKITQVNFNYLEVEKDSMNAGFGFEQEMINIAKIGT
ncbi:11703_t:CDS:2 [Dentiscutata heterogama]|uniref:11703_t:CDS:1 n=1 Tax=Dentiscutata heterogama TaxID=1316150 RepID=A0ACA9L1X1_9GLOM|nr:11703_t:CDS:2 [Dentiscutata heterogama]